MDSSFDGSWAWAIGLISFAFGLAFGAGIGLLRRGGSKRVHQLEEEMSALEKEFDGYRQQVTQHFRTTSDLVQKMTDSYRDVYEHLASSSQALCQTELGDPQLEFARQPLLNAETQEGPAPAGEPEFADAETDPARIAESDDSLGDAPHVPDMGIKQPEPDAPPTDRKQ